MFIFFREKIKHGEKEAKPCDWDLAFAFVIADIFDFHRLYFLSIKICVFETNQVSIIWTWPEESTVPGRPSHFCAHVFWTSLHLSWTSCCPVSALVLCSTLLEATASTVAKGLIFLILNLQSCMKKEEESFNRTIIIVSSIKLFFLVHSYFY